MERQKKNNSGITLVALVISIIVMLILAGVSLNATIGENGIVTRAQEAALQHRIATELENLNLELAKINVDTISTDEIMAIQDIASYLIGQGTIDGFVTTSAGQIAAGIDTTTGDKYFFGKKGDNTYRITRGTDGLLSAELTTQTSGGDITGGYALITAESFNNDDSLPEEEKGKFTITDDAEVVFMDTITGALSINVAEGVHATVGIYANMTLTNQGLRRSAIEIAPTAILDLYIDDGVEVNVNSGLGMDGNGSEPGPGGFAGIHVPGATSDINNDGYITKDDIRETSGTYNCAVLNLKGNGTIIAQGGKAGNGFSCRASRGSGDPSDKFGAGGGGAGAGIGGNGGSGGPGATGNNNGHYGESCGIVNLFNSIKVYAYGGGGGAGGQGWGEAGGGGGYPAAGIGGGGAGGGGGTCCTGSGGYSGGNSNWGGWAGTNGFAGPNNGGGGYFSYCDNYPYKLNDVDSGETTSSFYGGMSRLGQFSGAPYGHRSGNGGIGGSGGIINKSNESNIYAYNGNMYTGDEFEFSSDNLRITNIIYHEGHEYNNGMNQCPIYLQLGIQISHYNWLSNATYSNINLTERVIESDNTLTGYVNPLVSNTDTITVNSLIDNMQKNILGIGSGAGYIELSNGTYTVDSNLN